VYEIENMTQIKELHMISNQNGEIDSGYELFIKIGTFGDS